MDGSVEELHGECMWRTCSENERAATDGADGLVLSVSDVGWASSALEAATRTRLSDHIPPAGEGGAGRHEGDRQQRHGQRPAPTRAGRAGSASEDVRNMLHD